MKTGNNYSTFHRAEVIDNKDPEKFGRVRVWIPDLMPEIEKTKGMWARPANNPVGGRNQESKFEDHHYAGTSYIPLKGSWTWIFFEAGNPNRPYYFGALDLENTKVLPENQVGDNYELKWTIFKSHQGRCIIISDDPNDERVEITSKKRGLAYPPSGDTDLVYTIDGNQTTILLDERNGKEKVLIRTRKGDFLNIDVESQQLHAYFKSDVHLLSDANLYLSSKGDMHLKSDANILINSTMDMDMFAVGNMKITATAIMDIMSGQNLNISSGMMMNIKSGLMLKLDSTVVHINSLTTMNLASMVSMSILTKGIFTSDGSIKMDQMSASGPALMADLASPGKTATKATPVGNRD